MPWVVVCESGAVQQGVIKRQRVNGEAIGLTRLEDDRVVAFSNTCPHFKGPLTAGKIKECVIVCPWHFFRFNVLTGEAVGVSDSIMKLRIFPAREQNGEVAININGRSSNHDR